MTENKHACPSPKGSRKASLSVAAYSGGGGGNKNPLTSPYAETPNSLIQPGREAGAGDWRPHGRCIAHA